LSDREVGPQQSAQPTLGALDVANPLDELVEQLVQLQSGNADERNFRTISHLVLTAHAGRPQPAAASNSSLPPRSARRPSPVGSRHTRRWPAPLDTDHQVRGEFSGWPEAGRSGPGCVRNAAVAGRP